MREMIAFTGSPVKAAKLFGWCVLVGSTLREGESSGLAVDRLIKLGLSRGKSFEICGEIKAFKTHLEAVEQKSLRVEEVLEKVRLQVASPDGDVL